MLIAGSDDGVYRISDVRGSGETSAEKVLDAGRVLRVRQFDALEGVFAATESGLYRSLDGTKWTNLGVPVEDVYAVCANPAGDRLYVGTRPARVYVSTSVGRGDTTTTVGRADTPTATDFEWRELDGFRDIHPGEEWQRSRHEDVAQVRSLCTSVDAPERVIAGVEVGGVHVSEDEGTTWDARNEEVNDDVHHVHAVSGDEYVAATGFGLYRTKDGGRSWTRLDRDADQRYFRESFTSDGVLYAGGAHGSSSSWDEETDHVLFECRNGGALEEIDSPVPDELVVGWCETDDAVIGATHRGTLLVKRDDDWRKAGRVPVPGDVRGRYLPLTWYEL